MKTPIIIINPKTNLLIAALIRKKLNEQKISNIILLYDNIYSDLDFEDSDLPENYYYGHGFKYIILVINAINSNTDDISLTMESKRQLYHRNLVLVLELKIDIEHLVRSKISDGSPGFLEAINNLLQDIYYRNKPHDEPQIVLEYSKYLTFDEFRELINFARNELETLLDRESNLKLKPSDWHNNLDYNWDWRARIHDVSQKFYQDSYEYEGNKLFDAWHNTEKTELCKTYSNLDSLYSKIFRTEIEEKSLDELILLKASETSITYGPSLKEALIVSYSDLNGDLKLNRFDERFSYYDFCESLQWCLQDQVYWKIKNEILITCRGSDKVQEFKSADSYINRLPDGSEDWRMLKQKLLDQINNAKSHKEWVSSCLKEADEIVLEGKYNPESLFHSKRKQRVLGMINALPDERNLIETKLKLLEQVLKAEKKLYRKSYGHISMIKESGIINWWRKSTLSSNRLSGPSTKGIKAEQLQKDSSSSLRDPLAPIRSFDQVHFSITSPSSLKLGSIYVIDVWAFLDIQRQQVIERANEEAKGTEIRIKSKGPIRVERGTVLVVRLQIDDLIVTPVEDIILWEGEIGNATFSVTVGWMAGTGSKSGQAFIYANGCQVAHISFVIEVGSGSKNPERLPLKVFNYESAFISYASSDQDDVLFRVQAICKVLPNLKVFFARRDLRSGEKWKERLAYEIETRDVMYLFWSQAASVSMWVEWEWRRALEVRGIDFIDPFPLIPPELVPPPKELAEELHFGDWQLAFLRSSSQE